ncbi:hypothetical protein [Marinicella sp. W31]|uniref:hypothetical protein n=1 Tax=Marinicella sp. W31 TaxID=3023713 RepID=UPI0037572D35
MGWKGTFRSVRAAYRRAEREHQKNQRRREREHQREQRRLESEHKQYLKETALEEAKDEYEEYQEYYYAIKSLHLDCSKMIDWGKIKNSKKPGKPKNLRKKEKEFKKKESEYKPSIFHKLFKKENKVRSLLANEVQKAIVEDKNIYQERIKAWEDKVNEYKNQVFLADKLLSSDPETKVEILEDLNPFSKISALGSKIFFSAKEGLPVEITINVHGKEVIPSETKKLLQSGKLSVKQMPKTQYHELYQDHVSSVVIRIANEFFSVIPDDLVIVTAMDKLLNSSTGHTEETPILSALFSRKTLDSINLKRIDPSDALENFVHNVSFKKTKGFENIKKIKGEEYPLQLID